MPNPEDNQILRSDFCLSCYPSDTSGGLSIGVHSGFNPHPVSVFFLPHDGDISSFVHLLPPNSTVDKNAPSPLVVFCANSNANANVNNVLFVAAFKSIRSIPYLLNDCSFSLPLGCARSDTTFHAAILLQARRNLITQKNEEILFKSADNISTHVMDAQGRSGEVIDLVERVRFEIRYLVQFEENVTEWISESQLAECTPRSSSSINKNSCLLVSKSFLHK